MLKFNELGLSPNLLQGIDELGFNTPTPIQEKVIPVVFEENNDIVGLAQTGTGKTAAFGLPIIELTDIQNKNVQALILSPTRELCIQIAKDLKAYSKYIPELKIVTVYGGANIDSQIKSLQKGAHIISATPGRMVDILKRKATNISKVNTVVLDEADEMLNMGFRDELNHILDSAPDQRRTLLFSATMPADVEHIAKKYMHTPVRITIGKKNAGAENVRHLYYQVQTKDRYLALKRIADINPDIYGIVFCRTRRETKEVADKLIKDGYSADALHGDLSQAQRDHVMLRFREHSLQMLVATDVAARGLDVDNISHIINYNLPDELEVYTHRSGRTGRADKSGISISIVNHREVSRIRLIEKIISKKFEKHTIPTGVEICKKQLFKLIDKMEHVSVDEDQIAPFMDTVNKKLEWLSKEQIIKRFVSLEFNRFLDYYKNAPDLNDHTPQENKKHNRENNKRGDNYKKNSKESFTRFFINIGKKDGLQAKNIIGLINDVTKDRDINIGAIDLKDSFSFFEVEKKHSDKILKKFQGESYNGRNLRVEKAEEDVGGRNRKKHKKK